MKFRKFVEFFVILIVFAIIHTDVFADNNINIAVIPFKIEVDEDLYRIRKCMIDIVGNQLKQYGIPSIIYGSNYIDIFDKFKKNREMIKSFIIDEGIDYIIWGKIIKNNGYYNLDIRFLDSIGCYPLVKLKEVSMDHETILKKVEDISEKLIFSFFGKNIVSEIRLEGCLKVKNKSILDALKVRIGKKFERSKLIDDLRTIYSLGCFDHASVEWKNGSNGVKICYRVKESPVIIEIICNGNKQISIRDIRMQMNIKEGDILRFSQVRENIKQLESFYIKSHYHDIVVMFDVKFIGMNNVKLILNFHEGKKIFIDRIEFIGNKTFDFKKLKKMIKSSEKGDFHWFTNSGKIDDYLLLKDEEQLLNFYQSNGFVNVKIARRSLIDEYGKFLIIFEVEEGKRLNIGNLSFEGDLVIPKIEIMKQMKAPKYEWFNIIAIQDDIIKLKKIYSDMGFSSAEIIPNAVHISDQVVDLVYVIYKNKKVIIENIEILGNIRTDDSVIRRELKIKENDIYSRKKINISINNLKRLNFFEKIKINEKYSDDKCQVILDIIVEEKPTGQVTFGAGYSSTDKLFINGSVFQGNLFGKGESLRLSGTIGSDIDRYNLTFNEPWLFGIPLSSTIKLYKEIDDNILNTSGKNKKIKQINTGMYLSLGYPLSDFGNAYITYRYNVSEDKSEKIMEYFFEKYKISSLTLNLKHDSRDGFFYTKKGITQRLIGTYAGLGGNLSFLKLETSIGYYIPLYEKIIFSLRGKYGWIKDLHYKNNRYRSLRDSDFFHQGGMDSIRSYDYNTIGTQEIKDDKGNIILAKGGNQYLLFKAEITYPINEEMNLLGVLFYDTGQVFNEKLGGFKDAIGCGIRWFSPLGPIRLEGAYKVNNLDNKIKWNFAIGAPF